MTAVIDLDRRRPVAVNQVFEASDNFDPTKDYFLHAFHDDTGVSVGFLEEASDIHGHTVRSSMWLDPEQCRQFGQALIRAAETIERRG